MRTLPRKTIAGTTLLLMVFAGCSSSSKGSSTGTTATSTGGTASSTGGTASPSSVASGSSGNSDAAVAAYVGGKAQKATGSSVEIGFVNTDTGLSPFPLFSQGAKAAVAYANDHLDGINGHVIKLDACSIASEEDGTSCGTQMVNNPNVNGIVEGVLAAGSDTFFKVINNTKAVIQVSANSSADINPYPGNSQPNVFDLNAGAFGGYIAMVTYLAKYAQPAVKNVLLVTLNQSAADRRLLQWLAC